MDELGLDWERKKEYRVDTIHSGEEGKEIPAHRMPPDPPYSLGCLGLQGHLSSSGQ